VYFSTYNNAQDLPRVLQAIETQTQPPYVLHVIDDGSVDNTRQLLTQFVFSSGLDVVWWETRKRDYPEPDFVRVCENFLTSMQYLTDEGCDYMIRIGSDVILEKESLEQLVENTERRGLVYTSGRLGNEDLGFRDAISCMETKFYREYLSDITRPYFVNYCYYLRARNLGLLGYFPWINASLLRLTGTDYNRNIWYQRGTTYKYVGHTLAFIGLKAGKIARQYGRPAAGAFLDGYSDFRRLPADPIAPLRPWVRSTEWRRLLRCNW